MAWVERKLTSMTEGNNTISYSYDSEGIRTVKTNNGQTNHYDYIGSQLVHENLSAQAFL